jgi:adenylylsulfate kinase-like enzyme
MHWDDDSSVLKTGTSGAVFWITGLPRSGKSTLGRALCAEIRARGLSAVSLDGDEFRKACGDDLGFDEKGRFANARRLNGMCRLLSSQGLIVVCSTVSLISEIHALNRATLARYIEVLLTVPADVLRHRDPELYGAADRGEALLPGVNQTYDLPLCPHIVLESAGGNLCLKTAVDELLKWLNEDES